MTAADCCECGRVVPVACTVPPEPPVGTWVRDRYGALHKHMGPGWGTPGFMPFGRWSAMWHARGPLVECAEWGKDADRHPPDSAGGTSKTAT